MYTAEINTRLATLEREAAEASRLRDHAAREVADFALAGRTDTAEFTRVVRLYQVLTQEADTAERAYTSARDDARRSA